MIPSDVTDTRRHLQNACTVDKCKYDLYPDFINSYQHACFLSFKRCFSGTEEMLRKCLLKIADVFQQNEEILNNFDSKSGDGDCGATFKRASQGQILFHLS